VRTADSDAVVAMVDCANRKQEERETMASANKINERFRYVRLLPRQKLPEGTFLVHNHIVPVKPLSLNGFRAWVQEGRDDPPLIECHCDFGDNANADKNKHYRVRR